ncbi:hypothetical protein K474DRAFT_1602348 [Panus rudis PR-1116 ss-1]|nr:hypothetical protein K474DRAFT_1602348 [Panus rudis PR-1116 ss-1]
MGSSYNLVTQCPVRWTATQEKSIAADFPVDISDESPETFVSRIYQQFMFLPDSIMPLRLLVPAIRRLPQSGPYDTPAEHHLRRILESLLLTPRSSSEKYQTRVPDLLVDEDAVPNLEANILWYGAKYVKLDIEDHANEEEQAMAEEKWKNAWLERLEQREVMVQILLHFLILTLPEPEQHYRPPTPDPQPPTSSPRKRKRKSPPSQGTLSNEAIEDRLESFMDKLCMWQLTGALDATVGSKAKFHPPNAKGKQKAREERDWMQIFCEDVVEPLYDILHTASSFRG